MYELSYARNCWTVTNGEQPLAEIFRLDNGTYDATVLYDNQQPSIGTYPNLHDALNAVCAICEVIV